MPRVTSLNMHHDYYLQSLAFGDKIGIRDRIENGSLFCLISSVPRQKKGYLLGVKISSCASC